MLGRVNDRLEAVIAAEVGSPSGASQPVDLIVDTGFNGHLALPRNLIAVLGLPFVGAADATVADGRQIPVDLFACAITWDGRPREVIAVHAEGGALAGMSLIEGHRLSIEVSSGGSVLIDPLPPALP
mgnify:CR=1 FL=1